jgi:hypothetical protein
VCSYEVVGRWPSEFADIIAPSVGHATDAQSGARGAPRVPTSSRRFCGERTATCPSARASARRRDRPNPPRRMPARPVLEQSRKVRFCRRASRVNGRNGRFWTVVGAGDERPRKVWRWPSRTRS